MLEAAVPPGFTAENTTWSISPLGLGSISPAAGASASYVPPPAGTVSANTTVTVTATLNGVSTSVSIALQALNPTLSSLAGNTGGAGYRDGASETARFRFPSDVATDAKGNVYVADQYNYAIRKITPEGVVSTFAGKHGVSGHKDGLGVAAEFVSPQAVVIDSAGTVYVTDQRRIRKIATDGKVSTFAGSGALGAQDGSGTSASFGNPVGLAIDRADNIYVADDLNATIRKISPAGVVTTFAGSAGQSAVVDGTGASAKFRWLRDITSDKLDNLFVIDEHTIRKIAPDGAVTTLAGKAGQGARVDGDFATALFDMPMGIAADSAGRLYVTEANTLRMIYGAGVTTVEATAVYGPHGERPDGGFNEPRGLAVGPDGRIYIADAYNHVIRKHMLGQVVETLAGATSQSGYEDGQGAAAKFGGGNGTIGSLATDASGTIYVADTDNQVIRKISPSGVVTTLAGTPGVQGFADGPGATAQFNSPCALALDTAGNVYVADANNFVVRKISPTGVVTTFAGSPGQRATTDGIGSVARFDYLTDLAIDPAGNIYVTDHAHTVRKITGNGTVSTLAGTAGAYGSKDGVGADASFYGPSSVTVDAAGMVYVVDGTALRKITPAGVVTTLAGTFSSAIPYVPGVSGQLPIYPSFDATGAAARLGIPKDLASDNAGNLYLADSAACTIRKVTAEGVVTTVVGGVGATLNPSNCGFEFESFPGTLPAPSALTFFGGTMYIAASNGVIRVSNLP